MSVCPDMSLLIYQFRFGTLPEPQVGWNCCNHKKVMILGLEALASLVSVHFPWLQAWAQKRATNKSTNIHNPCMIEGSLEAKLPTIWKDGKGTARKKLGRGESQK